MHLRAKGKELTVVPSLSAGFTSNAPPSFLLALTKANCFDLPTIWTYRFLMKAI